MARTNFLLCLIVMFTLLSPLSSCAFGDTKNVEKDSYSQLRSTDAQEDNSFGERNIAIEFVGLKRRNWENHGTDVHISKDGDFIVTAEFLGRSKEARRGTITGKILENFFGFINEKGVLFLENEYKGPFQSETKWWGYELTIKADHHTKIIRFHSEDKTAPRVLFDLVEAIKRLTR